MEHGTDGIHARLLLLGTVHGDPLGFKRLGECLRSVRPDVILVELSPFGWAFRRRHQLVLNRTLHEHLSVAARRAEIRFQDTLRSPEVIAVRRQLALPFEYRAAVCYARKDKARVVLVDDSRFSRLWIASWEELLSVDNLVRLLTLAPQRSRSVEQTYELAARCIAQGEAPMSHGMGWSGDGPSWEERERRMAVKVGRVLRALRPRQPLWVGGWWHLAAGGPFPTLRDLLEVPLSRCALLHRAFLDSTQETHRGTSGPKLSKPLQTPGRKC